MNPADSERNARIGYEAQDKRAASLIYDLLIQGRLQLAEGITLRVSSKRSYSFDGYCSSTA